MAENILQVAKSILELQPKYKDLGKQYTFKRFLFDTLIQDLDTSYITGVSGLRGAGKTVLLLQLLNHLDNSVYISLDTLDPAVDLFKLASIFVQEYKTKYLLLDEVHFLKHWSRALKMIYDILQIKVFFTSSVSLDILSTREDLARRVVIYKLPVLSYREYLHLFHGIPVPTVDLRQFLDAPNPLVFLERQLKGVTLLDLDSNFSEYMKSPLPLFLKKNVQQTIDTTLEKIITHDILSIHKLNFEDRLHIYETLKFLANMESPDISVSELAKNLGVSRYKMKVYLDLLERAFVVHLVMPYGKNVLQEPKVLMDLPFRHYLTTLPEKRYLGCFKEDFFVTMLKGAGLKIFYLKNTKGRKTPDYLIELEGKKYIVEIGGKSKGFRQFKGIKEPLPKFVASYPGFAAGEKITRAEGKKFVSQNGRRVPLFAFGLLY